VSSSRVRTLPRMIQNLIVRNGEIFVAIVAAFIALLGAAAHIAEPIERSATYAR
jgi:hypothetical protein